MGAGLPLGLARNGRRLPRYRAAADFLGIARHQYRAQTLDKKGVLPDAIVIEHPAHAAGHLGAHDGRRRKRCPISNSNA